MLKAILAVGAVASHLALAIEFEQVRGLAASLQDEIVGWRRHLHSQPELMYQEHKTSAFIQEQLAAMGVDFTTGWSKNTRQERIPGPGGTGVVAEIGRGDPIVALRADIDALPIEEETPVSFRSQHAGRMHACGHDGHASMLLGAAKLLKSMDSILQGTVRLIFQPAEEGGAGAKRMCEEGVLRGVSRIFGLHLWPYLPSGSIGGRAGVTMAAGDFFELRIVGKGAHGAMPHKGVDPVTAAAAAITAVQTIVSRETDPLDSAVISVTKMNAGDAFNVIPAEVKLGGTMRSLTVSGMTFLRKRFLEVVTAIATAHQCTVEGIEFMPDPFAPTVTDPGVWNWLRSPEVALNTTAAGVPMHWALDPTMGSEDFGFYTEEVPGAFIFLGQGSAAESMSVDSVAGKGTYSAYFPSNVSLHSPRFNMDEKVLHLGAALHAHMAMRSLQSLAGQPSHEL
eukprot:TRINITY_DN15353_c0_g2_i1.p1 TRINITY_DN15353_c0_g2~~TRINITY_DN15353_c0_g2_i1.p1  ORF type:complete len:468 (+),score=43.50 TRINITY_DN15353_c0_g2_i1:51-1406(+)